MVGKNEYALISRFFTPQNWTWKVEGMWKYFQMWNLVEISKWLQKREQFEEWMWKSLICHYFIALKTFSHFPLRLWYSRYISDLFINCNTNSNLCIDFFLAVSVFFLSSVFLSQALVKLQVSLFRNLWKPRLLLFSSSRHSPWSMSLGVSH